MTSWQKRMVAPGNGGRSLEAAANEPLETGEVRIAVGPPEAVAGGMGSGTRSTPQDMILLLHGFTFNHHQLEATGEVLRDAGMGRCWWICTGTGDPRAAHIQLWRLRRPGI